MNSGKNVSDVLDNDFDKYHFVEFLGQGAHGKVFLVIQTSDQTLVVMKFIKSKIIPRKDLAALAKVWGKISHPNIVRLLDYFHSSRGFCFVTEYAPQGNLSDLHKKDGHLSTEKIQKYTVQLLQALDYLHSINIFHGSLKPQNTLIFAGDVIKICDFGLIQIIWKTNKDLQQTKGTLSYMSPETLSFGDFSRPSDLWSVGIVLYELLGGRIPNDIYGLSARVISWHITNFHGDKPLFQGSAESPQNLKRLVIHLLHKNPADRSLELPEFLSETICDVETMDQPLRTNTSSVGACDTARPEGVQIQDLNENTSQMDSKFDKALVVLLFYKDNVLRNEDVLTLDYSLDTISKAVDVDAFASERVLHESFLALKNFTVHLVGIFKPDYYDILVKCLSVVKEVLKKLWYMYGYSHRNRWIDILEFLKMTAAACGGDTRVDPEYCACIITMLHRVAQEAPEEMLPYSKQTGVINTLLSCLATISKSFTLDKLKFLRVACEASNAIWSLLTVQSLDQLNVEGEECKQIVHEVTEALLSDKAVFYAFYICLRDGSEDTQMSVIRIILRCCMYDKSVGDVLCHSPSSSHVTEVISGGGGGGGDGTIVSLIFHLLSSNATHPGTVLTNEIGYPVDFISDLCLVLATIAQSLYSVEGTSVESMLTSSQTVQKDRLSVLGLYLSRKCNSLTPSAMLALASIFSLESSRTSSFAEIALPLIPTSATLCENLRAVLTENGIERKISTLQACMDATVGLLVARLTWDRDSTIQQLRDGRVLEILINLAGGNIHSSDDQIGLSPVGVLWILSLLYDCRNFELMCSKKYIKFMSGLISDVQLEHTKRWTGHGGGKLGVGEIVYAVTDLLKLPLRALKNTIGRIKMERKQILEKFVQIYIEQLLEVGIPGQVVKWLEYVELEDAATPVTFLSRMTSHRSAIDQIIDKDLFHASTMERLLGTSSPSEVKLNILEIVSDVAAMNEVYYEHIERADILPFLQKFLTDKDPKLRMQVCEIIRDMCQHSDYFYGLLEKHKIAPLLVACYSDEDTEISFVAGTAIAIAAIHNELLHKDLGRCIPQLAKFLFSAEEDHKTKTSACYLLRALVIDSGKLCKDIIFEGAMEALIMLVENCLLHPCNQPEDEEQSLLDISLKTLENLCEYSYCGDYFHSSAHYPVIEQACREAATESKVAASVSHIFQIKPSGKKSALLQVCEVSAYNKPQNFRV